MLVLLFPGSAGTDAGQGGSINNYLIASCIENIPAINYNYLLIFLQVTIDNVGNILPVFLFISMHFSLDLFFLSSAEAIGHLC